MADLSKVKINGSDYNLKDAQARADLVTANSAITALQEGKQDKITATNMLDAKLVALDPREGTKLTATEVNSAIYDLEKAIETGGTGSVVTVEKATTTAGYAATYVVKQGGAQVGVAIDIPKDYLVKSAELKTSTGAGDPSGFPAGTKYIDFVVNAKDGSGTESHIYLNVADLVDAYTADESTLHMENNQFSVKAVPMNLVTGLADALALKADEADLQAEIARAEAAEAEKEDKDNLKAFAYADLGTATFAKQDIEGIKATGNLSGSAAITLTDADAAAVISAKADYTPSGEVKAAAEGGSFSALKTATFGADNNGVQIGGTNADSAVTVDSSNATVLGSVKTAAVAPSFVDGTIGTFVAPQLTIAESDSFAKAGVTASVGTGADAETLIIADASTGKASVCSGWNAGSWTAGTFNAGSAAEFENATVIGSISGGTAAAQVFTGNKYSVATTADTALKNVVFEGAKSEQLIPTGITYKKADAAQAGDVTITGAELAVGKITVAAQTVDVSPKTAA